METTENKKIIYCPIMQLMVEMSIRNGSNRVAICNQLHCCYQDKGYGEGLLGKDSLNNIIVLSCLPRPR